LPPKKKKASQKHSAADKGSTFAGGTKEFQQLPTVLHGSKFQVKLAKEALGNQVCCQC
jgi:hypothetical protein